MDEFLIIDFPEHIMTITLGKNFPFLMQTSPQSLNAHCVWEIFRPTNALEKVLFNIQALSVCKRTFNRKRDNTDDLNFHYSFIINLIKLLAPKTAA
jgi:hypothetical protein